MALPTEIKAITITKPGTAEVKTVSFPKLRDEYILVRPTAVAVNPTDWRNIDGDNTGALVGCDYAGIVEQVGSKVTKPFAKGDRICGVAYGSNRAQHEDGTFAEYIVVKGDLQIKIPDNLSDEEAATLGIGITTVGQGLYQALKLPLPSTDVPTGSTTSSPAPEILIYGGSTATGILGIQFAKASGYRVATTSSPHNAAYLQSLGADAVFNSRSPILADEIRAWSADPDALTLAWDCIGDAATARVCAAALSRTRPGHYRTLLAVDESVVKGVNEKVDSGLTVAYTAFGAQIVNWGLTIPAVPEDAAFAKMFWELSRELLAQGRVKAARSELNRGGKGLEGILVGVNELREGKVSGVKLVYML